MKKALKVTAIVLFAVFIAIQFYRPDFSNPQGVAGQALEETTQVPDAVENIVKRSCNACHSSSTEYPWYSRIAPSSWFLASHIRDGRKLLNFSEWGTYETLRKRRKLEKICEQVKTREMPLPSYLWIHWSAKLSDDEIKTLCDWSESEKTRLGNIQADSPTR